MFFYPHVQTPPAVPYLASAVLSDHAHWVAQLKNDSGSSTGADVASLTAEVARLREQLAEAKGVNDAMWESAVQAMLVPGTESTQSANGHQETNGRIGKRQRTG